MNNLDHYRFIRMDPRLAHEFHKWVGWCHSSGGNILHACAMWNDVEIARNCRIKRAIIDKQVKIGPDTVIGYDLEADRERYHVTESGIVVIPKGSTIN